MPTSAGCLLEVDPPRKGFGSTPGPVHDNWLVGKRLLAPEEMMTGEEFRKRNHGFEGGILEKAECPAQDGAGR
jgi:hypothetical protein